MEKMKSIVYEKYGGPDVLHIVQTPIPKPGPEQLLIKVTSSSVTAADWHLRKADPFIARIVNGFLKPKNPVLGQEFAGEVIKTGSAVTHFKAGDLVFGSTGMTTGAYSEFIVMDQSSVLAKSPDDIDQELLAAVPIGAMTALFFLEKGELNKDSKILINGASGSVGTYAVQIATSSGAHVTGVCSTANLELVRTLGADEVIDYKTTDFTRSNLKYDIIFDTVGNLAFGSVRDNLTKNGHFVSTAFNVRLMLEMMMNGFRKGKNAYTGVTKETKESLDYIIGLIESKTLRPVIDKRFSMEEIQEAHRYVESGRKKGNVLLKISGDSHARS